MLKASLLILPALLLPACATKKLEVAQQRNPPPAEAFSAFGRFELKPVEMAPEHYNRSSNYGAAQKIQEYFDDRIRPVIDDWTRKAPRQSTRTLVIEPRIEQLNYVSQPTRILTGPYFGDSGITVRLRYIDAGSGKVIAEPQFFQDTGKWWGWVTVGVQDKAMLRRMVGLIAEYNHANYWKAVGGRTGPD